MKRTLKVRIIEKLKFHHLLDWMPDKAYIKLIFWEKLDRFPDLKNPKTFNEKLQWIKLYDRNPIYTTMVDKYEAKKYVASVIGEEYIIPTLGVWDSFDEIDFKQLPNQFVLKCTHDSGGLIICKDKSKLDLESARKKINKSLCRRYYYDGREWPYKDVKPRIIAEQYMEDASLQELRDYKFFCFGGMIKCFKVDFDRFIEHHANYYDKEKNLLDLGEAAYPPKLDKQIVMPETLEKMEQLAEMLSKSIPFLRADFYDVNGKIYFGEMTFFPASGFGKLIPDGYDELLGSWIQLPDSGGAINVSNKFVCLIKPTKTTELIDYKFFCFNGVPHMILVCSDRFSDSGLKENFYDLEWNLLSLKRPDHDNASAKIECPEKFELMKRCASKISENIPFLRVDFYEINGQMYFGECTFFPQSGFSGFIPPEWDEKLGALIRL